MCVGVPAAEKSDYHLLVIRRMISGAMVGELFDKKIAPNSLEPGLYDCTNLVNDADMGQHHIIQKGATGHRGEGCLP